MNVIPESFMGNIISQNSSLAGYYGSLNMNIARAKVSEVRGVLSRLNEHRPIDLLWEFVT